MKKFLSIMALAAIMASCNSGDDAGNTEDSTKDAIDSAANTTIDAVDSTRDASKDSVDAANAGKDTVNKK